MNPLVQPPCANPPSRSSPECPGAWITPSSDTYSTTTKLRTAPPPSLTALHLPADRAPSAAWPQPRSMTRRCEHRRGPWRQRPTARQGCSAHQGGSYRRRVTASQEEGRQKTGSFTLLASAG